MKRPLLLLPLGLLAGLLAFAIVHWWFTRDSKALALSQGGELLWLKTEFRLTDSQFDRVSALHRDYRPTCAELCRRISEQNRRLEEAALKSEGMSPEVAALVTETGRVRDDCRKAMLAHLYAVAKEMPAEQGRRYLELMLSRTCVLQPIHTVVDVHADPQADPHAHHGALQAQ